MSRAPRALTISYLLPDLGHRTLVMGILNITPDSFSDSGASYLSADAVLHARRMQEEGADIWDVGGESTRPGAVPVDVDEELKRVLPVIAQIATLPDALPISLDTTKATVAEAGVGAGASLINDVSAGTLDAGMFPTVARLGVPICLMHLPVIPSQMGWSRAGGNIDTNADVVAEVIDFLQKRISAATSAGIARENILVDPGFGFGKSVKQNLVLVKKAQTIKAALGGLPLLLGTSRKSTIARLLGEDADKADPARLAGTAALTALSCANGADIVRVHDVGFMTRVVRVTDALVRDGDISEV